MPLATRLGGDTFRMLASEDNTRVFVNGSYAATINRGQFHEQIIQGPGYIFSDHPILLAQYSNSSAYDRVIDSDPMRMIVPPTSH